MDDEYDEDEAIESGCVRLRRGSEGWEVRPKGWEVEPSDREAIVQRYIASRGLEQDDGIDPKDPTQQPGRYRRYIPESQLSAGSEGDDSESY